MIKQTHAYKHTYTQSLLKQAYIQRNKQKQNTNLATTEILHRNTLYLKQ